MGTNGVRSGLQARRDAILDELAAVAEAMADPDRCGDREAYERLIAELEQVCRLLIDATDVRADVALVG